MAQTKGKRTIVKWLIAFATIFAIFFAFTFTKHGLPIREAIFGRPEICYRKMQMKDLDDVFKVEAKSFDKDAWKLNELKENFKQVDNIFMVAECGGKIVGFSGVNLHYKDARYHNKPEGRACLTLIAVLPEYRREKIGEQLVQKTISLAKERNCSTIMLHVRPDNVGAIKLYERNGFKKVAVEEKYYQKTDDANVMEQDLVENKVAKAS